MTSKLNEETVYALVQHEYGIKLLYNLSFRLSDIDVAKRANYDRFVKLMKFFNEESFNLFIQNNTGFRFFRNLMETENKMGLERGGIAEQINQLIDQTNWKADEKLELKGTLGLVRQSERLKRKRSV